jgi:hypothetical protein
MFSPRLELNTSRIIIIMTLQFFVGPWPLFQFLDLTHSRYDALERGSARRKACTYTQNNTNRIKAHNTDIHALSGIRTHYPSVRASEDSSCLRPRGFCYGRTTLWYKPGMLPLHPLLSSVDLSFKEDTRVWSVFSTQMCQPDTHLHLVTRLRMM